MSDSITWQRHEGKVPLPANLADVAKGETYSERWASFDVTKRVRTIVGITDTIPKDFEGEFVVDGHKVEVFKHGCSPIKMDGRRYFHRVFFIVGPLDEYVPVGRIVQYFNGKLGKNRG